MFIRRRSNRELAEMRRESTTGVGSIVYGLSSGASINDMYPFQGTATKLLQAVCASPTSENSVEVVVLFGVLERQAWRL